MELCNYGCGQKAIHQFKNGKWCCSKNTSSCPQMKKINSNLLTGRIFNGEHKNNLSKALTSRKRTFSESHRKRLGLSRKGKPLSKKIRLKISKTLIGHKPTLLKHTEESKKKISVSNMGKKHTEKTKKYLSRNSIEKGLNKGKNNSMFGKFHTEESKKKMGGTKKIIFCGNGNPNWKGGISLEPYCFEFTDELKEFIKERDNYNCQNPGCWGKTDKLCVHHIDYDKKHCEDINLITLCLSCNSRANFNREQWSIIYKNILKENYKMTEKKYSNYEEKYDDGSYIGGERVDPPDPNEIPVEPTIPSEPNPPERGE